eukprot:CAMPEP_0114590060 /NCGR_PEP_ID=MMETSP0125-20121206/12372_1 /TAXON_ID=485358 ORGANISM="Aristerostoma sp., Strain ATCC 50986" /NCGR_SAMPLE_ID=MMETSP0125 /ASSEMBLY_ACC=CAM_ASM_000245 /LENGTH=90 /DNA_ID=CAMNT_0001787297 /DNA_START=772 /DNA_END=1042 /DNA_ORIENTATION=-
MRAMGWLLDHVYDQGHDGGDGDDLCDEGAYVTPKEKGFFYGDGGGEGAHHGGDDGGGDVGEESVHRAFWDDDDALYDLCEELLSLLRQKW